ncbi:hypothetical protein EBZ39_15205 [bacterium]|nr:hypothetical protein [bacterium]
MAFTAVGFSAEHEGFCASRSVATDVPQSVADYLKVEFGLYFDQILLMKNGDDSPEVVHHWSIGEEYDEQ